MQTDTLTQGQFLEAIRLLGQPTWTDLGGVVVGFLQVGLIGWGLWQMRASSQERNRQLDIMEAAQREQSRTQSEALGKVGQALDRQGDVLAELLRRTGPA